MSANFEIHAELRSDKGKGASRRLRKIEDKIPGILYGGGKDPQNIQIPHNKIWNAIQNEAFFSHILTLKIDGKTEKVVIKDLQRHHYRNAVSHIDFQRVSEKELITMHVPLHFINEDTCIGVKQGGLITHHTIDIEIKCQANKLPEFIEVDLANIAIDEAVHLSDIKLPEGVVIPALIHDSKDYDVTVASVHKPRMPNMDDAEAETTDTADDKEKKEEAKK